MSDNFKKHETYLLRAIEVSKQAREEGNNPFGALLVGPDGEILMEQGNIEVTTKRATGHAETTLADRASQVYDKKTLWNCTLYTTVEPCAMCCGTIYWANIGHLVYGMSERKLLELTSDDEKNPTFDLPCREIFAKGQKDIKVEGPFEELEEQIAKVHEGFWKGNK